MVNIAQNLPNAIEDNTSRVLVKRPIILVSRWTRGYIGVENMYEYYVISPTSHAGHAIVTTVCTRFTYENPCFFFVLAFVTSKGMGGLQGQRRRGRPNSTRHMRGVLHRLRSAGDRAVASTAGGARESHRAQHDRLGFVRDPVVFLRLLPVVQDHQGIRAARNSRSDACVSEREKERPGLRGVGAVIPRHHNYHSS